MTIFTLVLLQTLKNDIDMSLLKSLYNSKAQIKEISRNICSSKLRTSFSHSTTKLVQTLTPFLSILEILYIPINLHVPPDITIVLSIVMKV